MDYIFSDGVYKLRCGLLERLEYKGKMLEIIVKKGFAWNGVTGFKTTKKNLIPSMIHDYLIFDERINGNKIFTRKDMDKIFIILCKRYNVPFWQIILFKAGLNINRNILMKLENKSK